MVQRCHYQPTAEINRISVVPTNLLRIHLTYYEVKKYTLVLSAVAYSVC